MLTKKITIVPAEGTWVVRAGGAVIGESTNALELIEDGSASQIYFPQDDIGMAFLEASEQEAQIDGLGRAAYFGIVTRSTTIQKAAWTYSEPESNAARIAGHISFDPNKVTVERV
ncbi:DUF427 domain-containing protein [Amaricoccus macauensis]|uniref:DUF427 domain-containing protein n=1 Tax=Amaricoccus macauensis TaxID=57001 RepID=UPI003C7987A3